MPKNAHATFEIQSNERTEPSQSACTNVPLHALLCAKEIQQNETKNTEQAYRDTGMDAYKLRVRCMKESGLEEQSHSQRACTEVPLHALLCA